MNKIHPIQADWALRAFLARRAEEVYGTEIDAALEGLEPESRGYGVDPSWDERGCGELDTAILTGAEDTAVAERTGGVKRDLAKDDAKWRAHSDKCRKAVKKARKEIAAWEKKFAIPKAAEKTQRQIQISELMREKAPFDLCIYPEYYGLTSLEAWQLCGVEVLGWYDFIHKLIRTDNTIEFGVWIVMLPDWAKAIADQCIEKAGVMAVARLKAQGSDFADVNRVFTVYVYWALVSLYAHARNERKPQ